MSFELVLHRPIETTALIGQVRTRIHLGDNPTFAAPAAAVCLVGEFLGDLGGRCPGGKFLVSEAGEAYDSPSDGHC
jgi:hypothetical protein